jgi:2-methylisocitrate lyase-like PEP mutase family enzyme
VPPGLRRRCTIPDSLRSWLAAPGIVVVPGVSNALEARIAERAGYPAVFVTGAGIANSLFGFPDVGLLTQTEIVDVNRRIAGAVGIATIADADTGYGNHLNVSRTVVELERAGVAAITIEDQQSPKRCGHLDGQTVIPIDEMIEKIVAATRARSSRELVLVARTDAIPTEGLEGALERGRAYRDAGADVIFVEGLRDRAEIEAVPAAVGAPCLINLVEGGKTPILPSSELAAIGYKLALHANLVLRVAARSVDRALGRLRTEGTSLGMLDDVMPWDERQSLCRLDVWDELDASIQETAGRIAPGRGRR